MENKQTEKSQAELYREERKQRMAKAAKKNSKKSPQLTRAGHIAGKVIGTCIIIALCLVVVYACLNFFGVPQKVLKATTVNDTKVSVAKYNFYYMSTYLNVYNQSYSYDSQYGEGMGKMYTGYDYKVSPMEQSYTGTLEGYENPTWADALKENALSYIQTYVAYSNLAKEEGITLTDEQKEELEEQISNWKETAKKNDYSLNRFLTVQYGAGVDEKIVREVLEEQYLAQNFAEKKQEKLNDAVTNEEIKNELTENSKDYLVFDISAFKVAANVAELDDKATDEQKSKAKKEAMAAAKKEAERLSNQVNDAASALAAAKSVDEKATADTVNYEAVTASQITSSFGDKVANWVFEKDRVAGDKAVIELSDAYAVVYLSAVPSTDDTKGVDVKHILVAFPKDDNGATVELTDTQKAAYKKSAQEILNTYLKDPTDDNFTALAAEKSEDPGSKDNGGLYECVYPGSMVTEFNDWIFDAERKPGDTDIVETTYGYHIMLYVGNDNPTVSENAAKTALVNNELKEFDTKVTGGTDKKIERSEAIVNWSSKSLEKIIARMYLSN